MVCSCTTEEVRVGVHADDIFSGAQLMYMAAFNSKMGALVRKPGSETLTATPLPLEGRSL